ncbi:MAG TPA: glycosyl hydrolase family 8 [Beijerinckiaceae bacterium]|nr:glycosyl hydrolase family 8 [Beijerinckiaceae bacterium]
MTRFSRSAAVSLCLVISAATTAAAQAPAPQTPAPAATSSRLPPLNLNAKAIPLGGTMKQISLWRWYVSRFVTAEGRVVDTGNGDISHSEGQGYGMLLAVAFGDRRSFDRIWNWTRANLMVRDDELIAWRWDPNQRPPVADVNDASDGDLLIAWALTEAAEYWNSMPYRFAARRIAVDIGRKLVIFRPGKSMLLLPAISGFVQNDGKGFIVNPSYWVFPALARLPLVAPEIDWSGLAQGGLDLLDKARFGASDLPSDWVSVGNGPAAPAVGFPPTFAYNSIRIPLYMAWAGIGERSQYQPFVNWAARPGGLQIVDVSTGRGAAAFSESGYRAPVALLRCVTSGAPFPTELRFPQGAENYYPATLHLLALVAAQMRYPSCLAD